MSRMLNALKTLEVRRATVAGPIASPSAHPQEAARIKEAAQSKEISQPKDVAPLRESSLRKENVRPQESPSAPLAPVEHASTIVLFAAPADAEHFEPEPVGQLPSVAEQAVRLPTVEEVSGAYLDTAGRISDQLAANYCNVLLFVTPDHWGASSFSMTHLAQAFALQCPGDILLVDGDLHTRRLSKTVCPPSRGMIEVMHGTAHWPEVIHASNAHRVDFVASGTGQVPTLERPKFGWGALRPLYRTVLIGVSSAEEPETEWLAERCDGVYVVISRPHAKRNTASRCVNALRAGGANVLGCIVAND